MELCIWNNTNYLTWNFEISTYVCYITWETQKHENVEYKINKQISTPQTHQLNFQTFKQFPNDLNILYAMHNNRTCEIEH